MFLGRWHYPCENEGAYGLNMEAYVASEQETQAVASSGQIVVSTEEDEIIATLELND